MENEEFHGQNAAKAAGRMIFKQVAIAVAVVVVVFTLIGYGCSLIF